MKYYTIKRPDGELVTIYGELVAAADPINTPPAAALRTPTEAAPPAAATPAAACKQRGRPAGWTGNHSTAGKRAAAAEGCGWAEIIARTCNACGINLSQLAAALEVHPTAVSKWKTGKWNPNERHAAALLRLYRASGAAALVSTSKEVTT